MDDNQENISSMHETLDGVLTAHNATWSTHNKFSPVVANFRAAKNEIHAIRLIQETPRTGAAVDKANLRNQLTDATIIVRDGVKAHAKEIENNDLLDSVNFSDSELKSCRDTILADRANVVFDAASKLIHELEEYFVTEADITAVDTLRKQYLLIVSDPRIGIVVGKSATKDLALKFKEIGVILEKMDIMVEPFKKINKTFVQQYHDARIIVDLGRRKSGTQYAVFSGLIRDFNTELPAAGASVLIVETGQKVIVKADGKFKVSLKESGIYTLQVTLEGYNTYTEADISIQLGNEIQFEIDLEPTEV